MQRVGVIGCGLMGSGIAQVCAQSGLPTFVREIDAAALEAGLARVDRFLSKGVDRGKTTAAQKLAVLDNLHGTTDLGDLADCDLVIEAITENREVKLATYRALDEVCKRSTVFASNTSSLNITELAAATRRSERVIGLHFFNPVPVMQLVEVVRTLLTDEDVIEQALGFVAQIGKTAVVARDRTGFIVNRLLVPYLLEAVRVFDHGLASADDIDQAMVLGAGYPMGPLRLIDFVGLDTTYYIANIMYDEFRESQFAPPPLLKRMVLAGHFGRKSGRGFYEYNSSPDAGH